MHDSELLSRLESVLVEDATAQPSRGEVRAFLAQVAALHVAPSRRRWLPRFLAGGIAVTVIGGGAAYAATDGPLPDAVRRAAVMLRLPTVGEPEPQPSDQTRTAPATTSEPATPAPAPAAAPAPAPLIERPPAAPVPVVDDESEAITNDGAESTPTPSTDDRDDPESGDHGGEHDEEASEAIDESEPDDGGLGAGGDGED